jgi:hypothetical protein
MSLEKLADINPKILYAGIMLAILIPLLYPIGLPLAVGENVEALYQGAESLQPGDYIIIDNSHPLGQYEDCGYTCEEFFVHCLSRGAKILVTSLGSEGFVTWEMVQANTADRVGALGKEYGTDWIYLGYIAGEEAGYAAIASDPKGLMATDYYGQYSVSSFLADLDSFADFKLTFKTAGGPLGVTYALRQWYTPYGVPHYIADTDMYTADEMAFKPPLMAVANGLRSAAEYQKRAGTPGVALGMIDTYNTAHIWVIIVVVLGNIGYWARRMRQTRAEKIETGA